ncbi:unnamed protein product [Xylocopa violacea]|uniref:DUF4220 domain-containing protein n=1 Tax=Xylocopa violacea TaxID=135666 RepID=A0ABP1NY41_XYLVO
MWDKVTPSNVLFLCGIGWFIFDALHSKRTRMVYFSRLENRSYLSTIYAHEIEIAKLGRLYEMEEHLTKSMYGDKS